MRKLRRRVRRRIWRTWVGRAWIKARTLRWVNRVRRSQGFAPLRRLPRGEASSAVSCPVARALREAFPGCQLAVGPHVTLIWRARQRHRIEHPDCVQEFIGAFDRGAYPELEGL